MLTPKQELAEAMRQYKAVVRAWERYGKTIHDNRRKEERALADMVRELKGAADMFCRTHRRLKEAAKSTKAGSRKKVKPTKEN